MFCVIAQAPQLKFLHLTTEQGLPDGTVRSVTQDKYGYMWLGTLEKTKSSTLNIEPCTTDSSGRTQNF